MNTLQPILDLLKGHGTWLTTLLAWVAAISAVLAPFAVWISHKLADSMNDAAATSDLEDDEYLRRLFSSKIYKLAAFLLNFANVRLPTLSQLERAIQLQAEAIAEAKKG